jgi:putative tryptophan/tyrosine transport system substrate-binding protein
LPSDIRTLYRSDAMRVGAEFLADSERFIDSVDPLGRRAAEFVAKILRAPNRPICPSSSRRKFELILKLKTATALGLTIPPPVLARADQVIDP